jgi:plastocyanin
MVKRQALFTAFIAVALGAAACGSSQGAAATPPKPVTHTVKIESMRFQPQTLTVNAGDTILWVNNDLVPHTATSTSAFDSALIDVGRRWQFIPSGRGTFEYVCTFHPTMKGTLHVK